MEKFVCPNCGSVVRKTYLVAVKINSDGPMFEGYPCMNCKEMFHKESDLPMLDKNGNKAFLINQECLVKDDKGNAVLVTQALPAPIDEDIT